MDAFQNVEGVANGTLLVEVKSCGNFDIRSKPGKG
jgi:hypothetical protein